MILNACREPDKIIKIVHNLSLIYLYSCVRHTAFASNKMEHLIKSWLHFFLINWSPNSYFIFTCLWNSGLIVCLVDRWFVKARMNNNNNNSFSTFSYVSDAWASFTLPSHSFSAAMFLLVTATTWSSFSDRLSWLAQAPIMWLAHAPLKTTFFFLFFFFFFFLFFLLIVFCPLLFQPEQFFFVFWSLRMLGFFF